MPKNDNVFRKILHLDLDAFFCAVEELLNPELRGKPFAVGGSPTGRGVVTSCSYAARSRGVRSAMPMSRALSICPELIAVRSKGNYRGKSREVMDIIQDNVNILQQISVDEAFVDVSDYTDSLYEIAKKIQAEININTKLSVSIGGGTNKLVAKVANNVGKSSTVTNTYPNAINIISPGGEKSFFNPLKVRELWGVGPKTEKKLLLLNIDTIGDILSIPFVDLQKRMGNYAFPLISMAKGLDDREVSAARGDRKSISQERTFRKDTRSEKEILAAINKQCIKISEQLTKKKIVGATIKIKLRYSDFSTLTRQATIEDPTSNADIIYNEAAQLLRKHWRKESAIRLIGTGISNLQLPSNQLSLWEYPSNKKSIFTDSLVKEMQIKYGKNSIYRGTKNK